jgi:hypothetical protein
MLVWTSMLAAGLTLLVQGMAVALAALACQAAANHGLQATRVAAGSTSAGEREASTVLTQLSTRLVVNPDIQATRTGASARVRVSGTALKIIPGLSIPVTATLAGPTEPGLAP